MASSKHTQRAILAGLSCGVGFAAPVIAYAVTLPFQQANDIVASGALPFVAGALSGVGIYAASMEISDMRAEERSRKAAESRVFGGAQVTSQIHMPAPEPEVKSEPSRLSGITGVIRRRRSLDDVPTISRAVGAPSEEEAWAMIDSMLDEDSPVSCDPARSRDVYQVAIDELKGAAAETGSINRADIEAAARAVAGSRVAPAGTTAQFVSLVANANATAASSQAQAQPASWTNPASTVSGDDAISDSADDGERAENAAAREAAVNSLWGASASDAVAASDSGAPYNDALASLPVISAADEPSRSADDTFASVVAAETGDSLALQSASSEDGAEVPMADYSGHEDMWAAALEVLNEPASQATTTAKVVSSAPAIDSDPTYVGTHSRVFPEDTARMSRRGIERAEAIAEGVLANRRHARVNEILQEEIDRIESRSVRRTGHEYLSVIEGGTASFPPLKAEA